VNEANTAGSINNISKGDGCIELPVSRFSSEGIVEFKDKIVQEQQMSVFLDGRPIYTFTCLPGDIRELVVGYLYLQGILSKKEQLDSLKVDEQTGVIEVGLKPFSQDEALLPINESKLEVSVSEVNALATLLESNSELFQNTGGVHSALLIKDTSVVACFEDTSRHSAVDKLAGWCVLNDYETQDCVFLFSGRVPLEIITKAIILGCPVIISPSAPTDLSINLAKQHGVTLIGFAKRGQFNVYTHPQRITL